MIRQSRKTTWLTTNGTFDDPIRLCKITPKKYSKKIIKSIIKSMIEILMDSF